MSGPNQTGVRRNGTTTLEDYCLVIRLCTTTDIGQKTGKPRSGHGQGEVERQIELQDVSNGELFSNQRKKT